MAPQSSIPNNNNNTREAGHSSRYHPPSGTGATTNASGFHNDRTTYGGFPPRQTNGAHSLQAILGTDSSSSPVIQQRQGPGQFPTLGWARGHTSQTPGPVPGSSTTPSLHTNGIGPSPLRGFGQQPLVEPMPPTPGDMPVAGWVSNSTLPPTSQYHPGNGGAGGSNGAAFFRTYRDHDNSTTPRHHVMTPELNFAEIGHGRGTSNGMDVPRGYGGNEPRDSDDEDLVVVDGGNHTPLTPPSGYGSTNVATPTPRRGYTIGDLPQSDGSGTDERPGYSQNPYRHQMERDGRHQPRPRVRGVDHGPGLSTSPQLRALQESVHQALGGGGVVPPDNLGEGNSNGTGGRGRTERRGWRNRLFGGKGGNGASGSGSGAGSSSQVLHERNG